MTGGKVKSSQTRTVVNRAANAFPMAAQTAGKSNSAHLILKSLHITNLYITAFERAVVGERTVCIDEMIGIQAIERKHKNLPLRPGKVKRQEFEYIRHGTQALIANAGCCNRPTYISNLW